MKRATRLWKKLEGGSTFSSLLISYAKDEMGVVKAIGHGRSACQLSRFSSPILQKRGVHEDWWALSLEQALSMTGARYRAMGYLPEATGMLRNSPTNNIGHDESGLRPAIYSLETSLMRQRVLLQLCALGC